MLDSLGERYGMLPSKILETGSTLDIFIMDCALSYKQYLDKVEKGEYSDTYEVSDLKTLMDTVRKNHG
jgi:hypothetical protein